MTSYKLQNLDKLYEYVRLDKEQSGLNVDILVDDCQSYKRDGHPLLAFIQNDGKEYIPVSVETTPQILDADLHINIPAPDLESALKFISINADLIRDFADERIDLIRLTKSLNK